MFISPSGVSGGLHSHIVCPAVAAGMILPNGFPLPPISENIAQAVGAGYMDAFNGGCKGFLATRLTSLVAGILPLKPGQSKLNCINNEQKKRLIFLPQKPFRTAKFIHGDHAASQHGAANGEHRLIPDFLFEAFLCHVLILQCSIKENRRNRAAPAFTSAVVCKTSKSCSRGRFYATFFALKKSTSFLRCSNPLFLFN